MNITNLFIQITHKCQHITNLIQQINILSQQITNLFIQINDNIYSSGLALKDDS